VKLSHTPCQSLCPSYQFLNSSKEQSHFLYLGNDQVTNSRGYCLPFSKGFALSFVSGCFYIQALGIHWGSTKMYNRQCTAMVWHLLIFQFCILQYSHWYIPLEHGTQPQAISTTVINTAFQGQSYQRWDSGSKWPPQDCHVSMEIFWALLPGM
jgi:hypothetical protein